MSVRHRTGLFLPLLTGFRRGLQALAPDAVTQTCQPAILTATQDWLNGDVLDEASDEELLQRLRGFYRNVVPGAWHESSFERHLTLIRFALVHVLFGADALGLRVTRCAEPGGAYHVPGIGPRFWFALAKSLGPTTVPHWSPGVVRGLMRLGLVDRPLLANSAAAFTQVARLYAQLSAEFPDLDACRLDLFFARVANLRGRDLGVATDFSEPAPERLAHGLRTLRAGSPTRPRAESFQTEHNQRASALEHAIGANDPSMILEAAQVRVPSSGDLGWVMDVVRRAALARHPADAIGLTQVAEVELFAALLQARSPMQYPGWDDAIRRGAEQLSDAIHPALPAAIHYELTTHVVTAVRNRLRVHPSEIADLFALYADQLAPADSDPSPTSGFGGFCLDTFTFLSDLATHNDTQWMAAERSRYHFAVRSPVNELCEQLATRYVLPVLRGEYGWDLDTDAKPGRAVSSINRNDFGRSAPYAVEVSVVFAPRLPAGSSGTRRTGPQFVVQIDANGVTFGVRIGRSARVAARQFRAAVQQHGELIFDALQATGASTRCSFGEQPGDGKPLIDAADLRQWAAGKELFAGCHLPPLSPMLTQDEFVGEVLLTFDRLVPLFAAAHEPDPVAVLRRRAGRDPARAAFDAAKFRATTYQHETWLARILDLLALKKQVIFQGVPGTGKTHVARQLARHLTGDRPDLVRLVQFHPGYSYEEFVEGIRPQAAASGVSYGVEPGVLAAFVARAAAAPADPHVLIIDELNRGNLPRVFGELLFLLEYREQEITLPYSKTAFRLPENLFILATLNPADHSACQLDQALRRRFSFVDVPPDPGILARYYAEFPPTDPDPKFGPRLIEWFNDLNQKLTRELGPERQIGHSFLMVPELTLPRFTTIWDHQIRPILESAHPGRADRLDALAFAPRSAPVPRPH